MFRRPAGPASSNGVETHALWREEPPVDLGPPLIVNDHRLEDAVDGLSSRHPHLSARSGLWTRQAVVLVMLAGLLLGGSFTAGSAVAIFIAALTTLMFVLVVSLRLAALIIPLLDGPGQASRPRLARPDDPSLPVYTILVPLFREARIAGDLIRALRQLRYPLDKLDIKIVLESVDIETIAAVRRLDLMAPFEVVIVPDRMPRTKPKALNYALQSARGDMLTIFDAEDIPGPDQLLEAVAAFRAGPPDLGCVQARLRIDNAGDNWLSGLFAAEYLALFNGLLPAFERMDLPIPLGGTSNHFPMSVIREVGAWDAYNVTEDADLGMRLARAGYRQAMITAHTDEEAPNRFGIWLRQRTRWLKGWAQTYIVHMRQPLRLMGELGVRRWLGLQAVLGGVLVSAFAYPVALALLAGQAALGTTLHPAVTLAGNLVWWLAVFNLVCGFASAMMLVVLTAVRARAWALVPLTLLLPFYWLLVSLAAYRALLQLVRDPFRWEKTEHGLAHARIGPS